MTNDQIVKMVNDEFSQKTFGVTKQYLKIHQPVYEKGELKIERIDREKSDDRIIVYLPVRDEYFFFSVYIDTIKQEIFNIATEPRNIVRLRATSKELTGFELQSFLKLNPTKTWNKDDLKSNGRAIFSFSCLEYEPNPEPDEFEDKLRKLLLLLQPHKEEVLALGLKANTYIDVTMDFHTGNQLLGGATIDLDCIKIMNDMGLKINFDFTAWGKPFR